MLFFSNDEKGMDMTGDNSQFLVQNQTERLS
jgi:hypothetical protein